MKAVWGNDYDSTTDKIYRRPVCPKCKEPFGKCDDGKYRCYNCGKEIEVVAEDMLEWVARHEERKIEYTDCWLGCKGKKTVREVLRRNPVTGKWQVTGGECEKCGLHFIV